MLSAWLASCREFQTPDEEMKKIVLKVVKQCVGTEGVEPDYIRSEVGASGVGWWLLGGMEGVSSGSMPLGQEQQRLCGN